MALFRTSNPALNENAFRSVSSSLAVGETMTVPGTVNKTGILLVCTAVTAAWSWNRLHAGDPATLMPLVLVGAIGGFVVAMVTIFKKTWAPVTAPVYALLEGLVLGTVSAALEVRYPGIAIQAVGLTFGVLFALLIAYRTGLVRATENFKLGVIAATGGIFVFYMVEMVLGFFGIHFTTINGANPIGIGFSVFVVIIAALNLVLDFDFIENAARAGAPKYMEWYGAFGLLVTLIWLYFESLRLLAKSRDRR
jgi:uncharacterized YccA/Bax inhibitor family protein